MAYRHFRPLLSLMIVLALAVGPMIQAVQATRMEAVMGTAAVSGGSVPDDCDGCAGNDAGMAPSACVASCVVLLAVLPPPAVMTMGPASRPVPGIVPSTIGYISPPDPYPPRPSARS
jgi:hypothetical protein